MSAVTGLHVITNFYAATITFTNTESSGNNRSIDANTTKDVGNAWIPWCDSEDKFPAHHMEIRAADLTLYFWQSGDAIHYSRSGWSANAPTIPGNSDISQNVAWTLSANGQPTQTTYVS